MTDTKLSRRDMIKVGVLGTAALALPLERVAFTAGDSRMALSQMPRPFSLPFRRPVEARPTGTVAYVCPDGVTRTYPRYDITQKFTTAEIMPGFKTPVFSYNGNVAGPTFRVFRGNPIAVYQKNALQSSVPSGLKVPSPYTNNPFGRWTSTHLHGSASMPQFDGYASDITIPGQVKEYFYPNSQPARTLWYHDHGVHHTAQNAYNGLAAMYIQHDAVEQALGIPQGKYDVPLVIRDAMFAKDGSLIYNDQGESGVFGDVILVNGVPWPQMTVERRKYRFRFLNASLSRSFEWSLSDGSPMTVIGTDGGLMHKPQRVTSIKHGQAERYEVIIDFAKYSDNALIVLRNTSPDNNEDYDRTDRVMRFRVRGDASDTRNNSIPANWTDLVPAHECMTFTEAGLRAQGVPVRKFQLKRQNGHWTVNGETWQEVIDSNYLHVVANPKRDAVEIWELENGSGGWFHPLHIHLIDFKVLSRNGRPAFAYERGPKDVVYVGENETVRVAMRFNGPHAGEGWPNPEGRYMMHCHNLVHEDHDMMVQFRVGDPDNDPAFDPIGAARPTQG